jgi:predicted dehydrogenase
VGHLYLRLARGIRQRLPVEPDFELGLRRHRLIDALQRSSDEQRPIAIA